MPDEDTLTPAERELAAALGALKPTAPAIDRDQLMFRAGRASARRAGRIWQITSAALAACLAISLIVWPKSREVVQTRIVVLRPEEPAGPPPAPPAPRGATVAKAEAIVFAEDPYGRLCDDVMRHGLDALPALARSRKPTPLSVEQLLGTPRSRPRAVGILQRLGLQPRGERQ